MRNFFKEREHADRIIQEVKDQVEGRGVSAGELVDALISNEEFWEKLSEVVAACLKDKKVRK